MKVQYHNVIDYTNTAFENNSLKIQKFQIPEIKHNSQMAELGYRSMDYIVAKMEKQVEEKNNNTQSSKIGPNFLDATYLQLFATSFTLGRSFILGRRLQNSHNNAASVQHQPNCE
jgi:hypothetical protein